MKYVFSAFTLFLSCSLLATSPAIAQDHVIQRGLVDQVISLRSSAAARQHGTQASQESSRAGQMTTHRGIPVANPTFRKSNPYPTQINVPTPAPRPTTQAPHAAQSQAVAPGPRVATMDGNGNSPMVKSEPIGFRPRYHSEPAARANHPAQVSASATAHGTLPTRQPSSSEPTATTKKEQLPVSVTGTAPSIKTQIVAPHHINVNQTAVLKIKLENLGDMSAGNVKLIARIPEHAKFARSIPAPSNSEGQVYEFKVNNIPPNQSSEITLNLIPTKKLPLEIGTQLAIENVQTVSVAVRQPELTLDIEGPTTASMGQELSHEVKLTNTGDGIVESVTLKSHFPVGIQPTNTMGDIVIPDLEPGRSVVVDVETIARMAGSAELKFSASAHGLETEDANAQVMVYQPELNVAASGPGMNFVGIEGLYTLELKNSGKVDTTNVEVKLNIPHGMQITTISREADIDQESGVLVWTFDNIAAESSETVMLKMLGETEGHQVCNINVHSDQTAAKQLQLATQVATRADLNVTITNQTGPVQVGGKAQFLVVVKNNGSSASSGITVNVELPESLTSDQTNDSPSQDFGGGKSIKFQNAMIEAGQEKEFVFTATATAAGEHIVRSILQAAGSERKMISESSVYAFEVNQAHVSEAMGPAMSR